MSMIRITLLLLCLCCVDAFGELPRRLRGVDMLAGVLRYDIVPAETLVPGTSGEVVVYEFPEVLIILHSGFAGRQKLRLTLASGGEFGACSVSVNGIDFAELPMRKGKTEFYTLAGLTQILTPRWNVLRFKGMPGYRIGLLNIEWEPAEWRELEFADKGLSLFNPGTGRDFVFRYKGTDVVDLKVDDRVVARFEPKRKNNVILRLPAGTSRLKLSGNNEGILDMSLVDDVKIGDIPPSCMSSGNGENSIRESISNQELKVEFILPGKVWDGERRFMAAGRTPSLRVGNREWAGRLPEKDRYGLADEFSEPAGYRKGGKEFLKFGVGVFQSSADAVYSSGTVYCPVRLFSWSVERKNMEICFRQRGEWGGYGYDYEKSYRLEAGETRLKVSHCFRNTGSEPINTSYYCHNLLLPGGKSLSPEVECKFGGAFDSRMVIGDMAVAESPYFRLLPGGANPSFYRLSGYAVNDINCAWIHDRRSGDALEIRGDFLPWKVFFFCSPEAISPEFHYRIELEPGEQTSWSSEYRFDK